MFEDMNQKDKLLSLTDPKKTTVERVSELCSSLSALDPSPGVKSVYDAVVKEKDVFHAAYKSISDDIEQELFSAITLAHDKKIELVQIEQELLKKETETNKFCSIYARVPPLIENKNDPDYEYFLSQYNAGTKLSQEISELNLRATTALNLQITLDKAFASHIIELDYMVKKLEDTMKTFKYVKTPELVENYQDIHCFANKLKQLIDNKDAEFNEFLKNLSSVNDKEEPKQKQEDFDAKLFNA